MMMAQFASKFQMATLVVKLKSFIILELDGLSVTSMAMDTTMDHIIDDDSGDD